MCCVTSRDTDTIMELRTALEVEKERGSRLRYIYLSFKEIGPQGNFAVSL